MSYAAAIEQLNAMAPELHSRPGQPRRKFSLEQVRTLLQALGNPHQAFPSVLIAGTNGKGSTAATLASILAASGLRTGLYTSPHLERPNERIRLIGSSVSGSEIADDDFARLYFRVHDAAEKLHAAGEIPQHPSYFEVLTALGFLYFAEQKIDIAVLEVGLGGRLDATNVVEPLLSIVTDIALDHMEWLGPTISAIAREKAGILRPRGTLITLPQHPEANKVLGEVALELGSRAVNAVPYMPRTHDAPEGSYTVEALHSEVEVRSPLAGAHQHRNVALAIAAAVELAKQHKFPITANSIARGIRNTRWPGRLECIERNGISWIFDVAHNPAGAWALRAGLKTFPKRSGPEVALFSCLRDKPAAEMAQILFPLFDQVILAPIHAARATSVDDLLAAARTTGVSAVAAESVADALRLAQQRAAGGTVVVSGSVYLVGEARTLVLSNALGPDSNRGPAA